MFSDRPAKVFDQAVTAGQRVALVTGGNRGIGREVCRQLATRGLRVVLTSRTASKAETAARALRADGLDVVPGVLDVTDVARPAR